MVCDLFFFLSPLVYRIEAVENIEEALTGLKVIDFEGNTIRVSLRTYLPDVEGMMCQLNADDNMKQSEVNHELLIEVVDGTMELKNVEVLSCGVSLYLLPCYVLLNLEFSMVDTRFDRFALVIVGNYC